MAKITIFNEIVEILRGYQKKITISQEMVEVGIKYSKAPLTIYQEIVEIAWGYPPSLFVYNSKFSLDANIGSVGNSFEEPSAGITTVGVSNAKG